jgi:putative zinc finger/helix-turn-helix YgiT family protein
MKKNIRHSPTVRERPARARIVPEDECTECGTLMRPSTAGRTILLHGEPIPVPGVPHVACPRCGNTMTWIGDIRTQHLAAIAIYRERHGLLTAAEIRALRVRHRLTQAQLAKLLGLGTNTLSRWEAGRNAQSASMDILLRLVRDVPGALEYLRRHPA